MKYFASLFLALLASFSAHSQTVATCPGATPGNWVTGAWLPCTKVVYVPVSPSVPLPANAIVADMKPGGSPISWSLASSVPATDAVWEITTAQPNGQWLFAVSPNFVVATTGGTPPYTTSAVLSWTAPTTNVDGTTPVNMVGYNIYSGPSITGMTKVASVGTSVLTYQSTVGVGTTYFTVTAFSGDTPPLESVQPAAVSKTVIAPVSAVAPKAPGSVAVK